MAYLLNKNGLRPEPEMETVENCPLCGSSASIFLFSNYDRRYNLPGNFGTISCENCGFVRLSPRPTSDAMDVFYPDDYGAYTEPEYSIHSVNRVDKYGFRNAVRNSVLSVLGYEAVRLKLWQRILKPIFVKRYYKEATYGYGDRFPRFIDGGRALEVGCGNGAYLSYLKHHGWNVQGVDMSGRAAKIAKELFDIDVFVGQIEDADLEDESLHYIHLSHVVEHFFDPLKSMKKIARLLKPGGTIYVEVPNARGIGAEMSGKYWYGWDAPRHLFMFSVANVEMLLEKSGLSVTTTQTSVWDSFAWAETYKQEETNGAMLEHRPTTTGASLETVKRQWSESKQRFNKRPLDGDFISCWAQKPVGQLSRNCE